MGGTLLYYSLHRLYALKVQNPDLNRPQRRWQIYAQLQPALWIAAVAGAMLTLNVFFLPSEWLYLAGGAASFAALYSLPLIGTRRVRDMGSLKTIYLALAWLGICYVVPQAIAQHFDLALLLARFLFFLALALLFDLRDVEKDRQLGVLTISARIGAKLTIGLAALCLLSSLIIEANAFLHGGPDLLLYLSLASAAGLFTLAFAKPASVSKAYFLDLWLDGLLVLPVLLMLIIDQLPT